MSNTIRTQVELLSDFANNTTGKITPQNMRDLVVTLFSQTTNIPSRFSQIGGIDADILTAELPNDFIEGGWSGSNTGRTFIQAGINYQIKQSGFLRGVTFYIPANGSNSGSGVAKIKVLRPNSSTINTSTIWTLIGESTINNWPVGESIYQVTLDTPILCKAADYLGVYLYASGNSGNKLSSPAISDSLIYYKSADLQTGDSTLLTETGYGIGITGHNMQPYFCVTGDSIIAGHNTSSYYYTYFDAIVGTFTSAWYGQPTIAEPAFNIFNTLGTNFTYENHAVGGQTFDWVVSTGLPAALKSNPKLIIIHCGVNDIYNNAQGTGSATLVHMTAQLNAIRALVPQSTRLLINEILPWGNSEGATDSFSALTRQWNALLSAWCSENKVKLVLCHDTMGQTRISTGQLDNLNSAYDNGDGIHLNVAGVKVFSDIMSNAIVSTS